MNKKYDLRSAIEILKEYPGELVKASKEVDPHGQIAGVYRHLGAFGTVKRPTKLGPAVVFEKIKGFPETKVLIGLLSSRQRVGYLLDEVPAKLAFKLNQALDNPLPPVIVEIGECQEVIHLATDPDFDIRKILPAPTNTLEDAGPYITMGMCYATDPVTKESDITIHRLCLQSKDEITMFFTPGVRHLDAFRKKAEEDNQPLPISISIGVDPAIEIASCFESPTTPLGYNELQVAGGLRNQPVELVKCISVDEYCIANSEYVIEGELLPKIRMKEDINSHTGKAMPEFPGYTGPANPSLPVIKVKAITHRKQPIMQTVIGPSEEHVSLAGIPTEASILKMVEMAMPGKLLNVYCPSFGGGKFVAIMQFKKTVPSDEGRQRQAALLAFSAFSELKHVYIVDEDVDIFDINDVMWAMTTRFQGDKDIITIPGVRCHPLDPSNDPDYSTSISDHGIACKTIFDGTVPFHMKDCFKRADFMEVEIDQWSIEGYQ